MQPRVIFTDETVDVDIDLCTPVGAAIGTKGWSGCTECSRKVTVEMR